MNKHDLKKLSRVNSVSIAEPDKRDNITTGALIKICEPFDYTLEDIIETVKD